MILAPFQGPRLKAEWANRLTDTLEKELQTFSERAFMQEQLEEETETHRVWVWRFSEQMPANIPLLVGDAVHNARSALDILLCDIARLRGKPTGNVKFIISKTKDDFEARIRKCKEVRKLGADIVTVLRDIHEDENSLYKLRKMHELDVADKHELVIPAICSIAGRMSGPNLSIEPWQPGWIPAFVTEGSRTLISRPHGKPFQPPLRGPMTIRYEFEKTTTLGFYNDKWEGHLIPALRDFAKISTEVVEVFAYKFGGGDSPP